MYLIRQYDNLSTQDKYKQVLKTKDRDIARRTMKEICDSDKNGNWILWQKSGEDMIRLQVIQNQF